MYELDSALFVTVVSCSIHLSWLNIWEELMPEHSFHAISSSYKVKGKPQDAYLHTLILQPFFLYYGGLS